MRNNGYGNGAGRRVMIFIDGSNLYHVLKQNTDKRDLDYKKFSEKLCGDRELIRTYYYNIRQESADNPSLAESQDRFLNALYETDYLEVKLGIWKPRGNTMVEKGVDVMIAADLISHAYEDHYDTAILVSGDADFYPALQVVKDTGKQVEVAAFDSNLSSEAARLSDVLVKFDRGYFDGLWMSSSQKSNNMRAAARRQSVTDEAASPNGEDKGVGKNGTHSRRPFTARYADRRNAYQTAASRNGSRGKDEGSPVKGSPVKRVRRTETRRSLTSVLEGNETSSERTSRRGLATKPRVAPPDQRTTKRPVAASAGSKQQTGGANSNGRSRGSSRRDSWVSRMFGARK